MNFFEKKNLYCFENKNKNPLTKQTLMCYKNVVDIIIIVTQFVKFDFENMNLVMCSIHTTYKYIYIYIYIIIFRNLKIGKIIIKKLKNAQNAEVITKNSL